MPPLSELQELVLDRLIATGASDHTWSDYVLAALQGDAGLRAALDGVAQSRPQSKTKPAGGSNKPVEPPGVFVAAITVAGFRDIGPLTTLLLKEWREGWRNLHQPQAVALSADLVVEGKGPLTVKRTWTGQGLDEAETSAQAKATSHRATVCTQVGRRVPALSCADLARRAPDAPSNSGRRTAINCTTQTRVGHSRAHAAHRLGTS